jgi:hypothetical protein
MTRIIARHAIGGLSRSVLSQTVVFVPNARNGHYPKHSTFRGRACGLGTSFAQAVDSAIKGAMADAGCGGPMWKEAACGCKAAS